MKNMKLTVAGVLVLTAAASDVAFGFPGPPPMPPAPPMGGPPGLPMGGPPGLPAGGPPSPPGNLGSGNLTAPGGPVHSGNVVAPGPGGGNVASGNLAGGPVNTGNIAVNRGPVNTGNVAVNNGDINVSRGGGGYYVADTILAVELTTWAGLLPAPLPELPSARRATTPQLTITTTGPHTNGLVGTLITGAITPRLFNAPRIDDDDAASHGSARHSCRLTAPHLVGLPWMEHPAARPGGGADCSGPLADSSAVLS
jgi:hypothetical protein